MVKLRTFLLSVLFFAAPIIAGCGDSLLDDSVNRLGSDTQSRVAHESWGFYRLYRYESGTWQTVVDQQGPTGQRPLLNERPVLLVHGLGSNISSDRLNNLADSLVSSGATSVFGFEYDSLDPISTNGAFLIEAMNYLTADEQARVWRLVGHSMGGLVVRSAIESRVDLGTAPDGNLVSFVAVPHLGSEVAEELQEEDSSIVQQAIAQLVLNGDLFFFNADGRPIDVMGTEPSFQELVPNSAFLEALNFEASNRHPEWIYRTLAGTERDRDYEVFNRAIGVFADDGIVNVGSATAAVIGPAEQSTVPQDHSAIILAESAVLIILRQLNF